VEILSAQGLEAGSDVAGARAMGYPPLASASPSGAACTGYTHTDMGAEASGTASPHL
jgi:hypothetical protein